MLELEVGAVAHGGHCVARHEGRVVFVRHALPGERVRVVVTEDGGGSYCRADAVTVLDASPDRVDPPCPVARPGGCGGCDFQHADVGAQRRLKAEVIAEQLRRLAGIEREVSVEELPGGPLGWRSRVRLAVDMDGMAGLRPHRSDEVIPIADCALAPEGLLPPVLGRLHRPGGHVHVVQGADGAGVVTREAAGRSWRLSAGVFWQVHPAMPDMLAGIAGQWAAVPPYGRAWDLYGGVGLLASVLAQQAGRSGSVTVVESDRRAVADGRRALADLPQIGWRTGRVEHVLPKLPGRPDVVVADPPRRGLGRAVVDAIATRQPARMIYVACDPASLARDVALFAGHGYQLTRLRALDAFPMTHHVECVALLEPPGAPG
jgi:tRNA/tmRNA/rRNA uracil-C5-methylase (TrmA/RlmC/RlmD family)